MHIAPGDSLIPPQSDLSGICNREGRGLVTLLRRPSDGLCILGLQGLGGLGGLPSLGSLLGLGLGGLGGLPSLGSLLGLGLGGLGGLGLDSRV